MLKQNVASRKTVPNLQSEYRRRVYSFFFSGTLIMGDVRKAIWKVFEMGWVLGKNTEDKKY